VLVGERWVSRITGLGKQAEIGESVVPDYLSFFSDLRDSGRLYADGVRSHDGQKGGLEGNDQKKCTRFSHDFYFYFVRLAINQTHTLHPVTPACF